MSGGLAVKAKKMCGLVRAGAQRLHGPRFLPALGLDGSGAAGPLSKDKVRHGLLLKQQIGAWAARSGEGEDLWDIFYEEKDKNIVLVLRGIHAATQLIAALPRRARVEFIGAGRRIT
jgi:hypothetical protein